MSNTTAIWENEMRNELVGSIIDLIPSEVNSEFLEEEFGFSEIKELNNMSIQRLLKIAKAVDVIFLE